MMTTTRVTPELLAEIEDALALAKTLGDIKSTDDLSNLMVKFVEFADAFNEEASSLEYTAKRWREKGKTMLEYYRIAKGQQQAVRDTNKY